MSSNDSKYYSPSSSSTRKSPSKSKHKSKSRSRSRSRSRSTKNRFRKSKTPDRKTSSFSPSSGGDSSDDDFPKFRANWGEKSPGSSSEYPYEELREIDDLLRDARNLLKELVH